MSEDVDVVADFEDEIKRLRAINAELLAALEAIPELIEDSNLFDVLAVARTAIAKARGEA